MLGIKKTNEYMYKGWDKIKEGFLVIFYVLW